MTDGTRTRTLRSHNSPTLVSKSCHACSIGLDKPISLLAVAYRSCVLRPEWCQK